MCGCVYHVLISISGDDGNVTSCSQAGPDCKGGGVFGGMAWGRQKKKARMNDCLFWKTKKKQEWMNDCHWDSEGDVYGCRGRMDMEMHCMHLVNDKDRFEFLWFKSI